MPQKASNISPFLATSRVFCGKCHKNPQKLHFWQPSFGVLEMLPKKILKKFWFWAILSFESEFWSVTKDKNLLQLLLFFSGQTELRFLGVLKFQRWVSYSRSSTFLQQSYQKTFRHFCILTTQSFLGVVFLCPDTERERHREREREREREIKR